MEPKFKSFSTLPGLQTAVDALVYRLLNIIGDGDDLDAESLSYALEEFAGRDYIVHTKVANDIPLSENDKLYLCDIIKNKEL
jgi:hypothetical protein